MKVAPKYIIRVWIKRTKHAQAMLDAGVFNPSGRKTAAYYNRVISHAKAKMPMHIACYPTGTFDKELKGLVL